MYQVEGYAFETKEQEHTAKHEVEIIGYIRKNTRMDDPDIVLALYNKLVLKFLSRRSDMIFCTGFRNICIPFPISGEKIFFRSRCMNQKEWFQKKKEAKRK